MYPEGGGDAAPAADYYSEPRGGFLSKNLEGFIPLILILIIAFFLAIKFGVIGSSTPIIGVVADVFGGGGGPASMLIIGNSSQETINVLNESADLVQFRVKSAEDLERNPKEQLAQYDIILLDQSMESNKTVSRALGEAVENYVKSGGKLIVVKNSGIYRKNAPDVIGWEATFGDVVPVECDRVVAGKPTCTQPIVVKGKIYREDEDHQIMRGIEMAPADPNLDIVVEAFDVSRTGKEVAYIQDAVTKRYYTAIVEKNLIIGKSIYFNYNPGKTPGIFQETLEYFR